MLSANMLVVKNTFESLFPFQLGQIERTFARGHDGNPSMSLTSVPDDKGAIPHSSTSWSVLILINLLSITSFPRFSQ